jgi:parvulin-like peptidyl-prolyl isomerase
VPTSFTTGSQGNRVLGGHKGVKKGEAIWYSIQALPDVLRAQLSPYEVGRVSKPIYTEAGYVIFRVVGRRNEGILSVRGS